jgi:hypothetical protein
MRAFALFALISTTALSAPALAEDLVFELINNSSVNLQQLYVSPSATDTWGEDILGVEILAAGETGTVTIADGLTTCAYDLRFVTDTGNEVTSSQDLCALATFTLND